MREVRMPLHCDEKYAKAGTAARMACARRAAGRRRSGRVGSAAQQASVAAGFG
jgi:hypothetical protein